MLIAGVAALSLTSCTDDLDTKPFVPTTLLPDQAWSNDSSYEAMPPRFTRHSPSLALTHHHQVIL